MLFKIPFLLANAYIAGKAPISPSNEELIKESERKMAPFAPYIVMAERVRWLLYPRPRLLFFS